MHNLDFSSGREWGTGNARKGRLGGLCRAFAVLSVALWLLLLAGCTGPQERADSRAAVQVSSQTAHANDERAVLATQEQERTPSPRLPDGPPMPAPVARESSPPVATVVTAGEAVHVTGRPAIAFEETVHDYGEVAPRSQNVCEFRFRNSGTSTLTVGRKIDSTCGCTVPILTQTDYAPGEEGVIKVTYTASSIATTARKTLTVHCNDPDHPQVQLMITAKVVPRVVYEPKQLELLLKGEGQPVAPITLRSLDDNAFAVTGLISSGNCITGAFDPSVQAKEFTIPLAVDMDKLRRVPTGYVTLTLTHPACARVQLRYRALSEFQFTPPQLVLFNVKSNEIAQRDVWLSNNYGEDFEVTSVESERAVVKVLEKQKLAAQRGKGARYRLRLSITPPVRTDNAETFTDTLSLQLDDGTILKFNCRCFYGTTQFPNPGK